MSASSTPMSVTAIGKTIRVVREIFRSSSPRRRLRAVRGREAALKARGA